MHNLVSFNQLAYWNESINDFDDDHDSLVADYFQCLTECDDDTQTCQRLCRGVFNR